MKLDEVRIATDLIARRERYLLLQDQASNNKVFILEFNGVQLPVSRKDFGPEIDRILARVIQETTMSLRELGIEIPNAKKD